MPTYPDPIAVRLRLDELPIDELEHFADMQSYMLEGDTMWQADERAGATMKADGLFYPVTSWEVLRGERVTQMVTIVNTKGYVSLAEATIHAALWSEDEGGYHPA